MRTSQPLVQGPSLRSAFLGAAVWIVVSFTTGWLAVRWAGDNGSVLQLFTGVLVGLFGALAHVAVCFFQRFRALGFLRRAFVNWLLAYLPFAGLALLLFDPAKSAKWDPHFWQTVFMFLVPYTGLPMALLAGLVALTTSTSPRHKLP